jgi:hypothetical protein
VHDARQSHRTGRSGGGLIGCSVRAQTLRCWPGRAGLDTDGYELEPHA